MAIALQITAEQLPESVCNIITSEQDRLNLYADYLRSNFPGDITGIAVGQTPPDDTTKAWLQLDNNLYPTRIYYFANGHWQSRHTTIPGTIILWDGALPDFNSFDGGDSGTLGLSSGPMWEEVTELRAKFPIGVGTLPDTTTNIAVTDTGGNQTVDVTLTEPNLPPHSHEVPSHSVDNVNIDTDPGYFYTDGSGIKYSPDAAEKSSPTRDAGGTDGAAVPVMVNVMPPYYGVYFLRKTARLFYKV